MRILAVDDEFVALTKMVALLGEYGRCDAATNGKQAYEMFAEALMLGEPYDLVTIDINMPEVDGLHLLEKMHKGEAGSRHKTALKIMITAESTPETVMAAGRRKCDAFLAKPIQREVLQKKLAELGLEPKAKR
jgi:two-component system chemotaxis response regulator CheY